MEAIVETDPKRRTDAEVPQRDSPIPFRVSSSGSLLDGGRVAWIRQAGRSTDLCFSLYLSLTANHPGVAFAGVKLSPFHQGYHPPGEVFQHLYTETVPCASE